jgi:hypothetical protein
VRRRWRRRWEGVKSDNPRMSEGKWDKRCAMERNRDRRRRGENARNWKVEDDLEGAARCISGMTCGGKSHRKFTVEEDEQLRAAVEDCGVGNWRGIASRLPGRTVRQVRDRWQSYLSEEVRSEAWSGEEDERLLSLYGEHGGKWVKISQCLPGRTDVMVKNRYNQLARRMKRDMDVARELLSLHPRVLLSLAAQVQKQIGGQGECQVQCQGVYGGEGGMEWPGGVGERVQVALRWRVCGGVESGCTPMMGSAMV